jgi:K+-sensing histidine kinase KdpD
VATAEQAAAPIFAHATAILQEAGVPAQVVEMQISTSIGGQDVVPEILAAARAGQHGTFVVGREAFSWLQERFHHHVGDELIRQGQGLTIWVVE